MHLCYSNFKFHIMFPFPTKKMVHMFASSRNKSLSELLCLFCTEWISRTAIITPCSPLPDWKWWLRLTGKIIAEPDRLFHLQSEVCLTNAFNLWVLWQYKSLEDLERYHIMARRPWLLSESIALSFILWSSLYDGQRKPSLLFSILSHLTIDCQIWIRVCTPTKGYELQSLESFSPTDTIHNYKKLYVQNRWMIFIFIVFIKFWLDLVL